MRLSALLLVIVLGFLALTGFRLGALPYIPDADFSDAAISHWPAALYLRESILERGEFPVWRDTIMGGQPFAANPLNKTAYPLQWLVLLLPPALHLNVMILLHLVLAGWGMARWSSRVGLRPAAAVLAALAFALSPRLIAHLGAGHLDLVYALAWWPWLMEAVRRAVTGQAPRHIAILRIVVLAGLVFLADLRLSLFALSLAAFYALYEGAWNHRGNLVRGLWPVLPLWLLVVASVIVPVLGWAPYMSRAALSPDEAGLFSLSPAHFLGLLVPGPTGTQELLTYVGLSVLALAVLGFIAQPRRMAFWVAAILLAAFYALGVNGILWSVLVRVVPGLAWFRVPSRAWLVVALVAPLLAGHGLQALLLVFQHRRRVPRLRMQRFRLLAMVGFVIFAAGGVFFLIASQERVAAAWLLGGAVVALAVMLGLMSGIAPARAALIILVGLVAELAVAGTAWLTWRGSDYWIDPYRPLAERLVAEGAARVYAPIYQTASPDGDISIVVALPQEVAEAYDLSLLGGIDPFQLTGFVAALNAIHDVGVAPYSVVQPPVARVADSPPVPDAESLARWGVSHLVTPLPIPGQWDFVARVEGVSIYANPGYDPSGAPLTAWGWPADAPGFPDDAAVERLNEWTGLLTGLSFALFAVIIAVLVVYRWARRPTGPGFSPRSRRIFERL